MYQGINRDNLIKDITKLEYQNGEINKELKEFCNIKKSLERKYTSPTSQEEINNNMQKKVNSLRNNRDNEINLFKDKIILYDKTTKKTEEIFNSVKTDIKIK